MASQKAIDLGATDLQRGRSLGVAPYVEILNLCDGQNYEDFDSLSDYLDEDVSGSVLVVFFMLYL